MLGDTQARTVAGPQLPADIAVAGQRKHAAAADNPALTDDNRSIVQRRLRIENVFQQLTGNLRIQSGAGSDAVVEDTGPLKDSEGAGLAAGEVPVGSHCLGDRFLQRIGIRLVPEKALHITAAYLAKEMADLRLKHNDQRQKAYLDHTVQNKVQNMEIEQIGQPQQGDDQNNALQNLTGMGMLRKQHQPIEDISDDRHIQQVEEPNGLDIANPLLNNVKAGKLLNKRRKGGHIHHSNWKNGLPDAQPFRTFG